MLWIPGETSHRVHRVSLDLSHLFFTPQVDTSIHRLHIDFSAHNKLLINTPPNCVSVFIIRPISSLLGIIGWAYPNENRSDLWNSMTSTTFVFTELANTMKYEGWFLYNLVFTEWRHCVLQNEVWGRGCYITFVFTKWPHCVSQLATPCVTLGWDQGLGLWCSSLFKADLLNINCLY